MFEGLKSELTRVELRLRKLLTDMSGRIQLVEHDVSAIDEPVQNAFDRLDGSVVKAQGVVREKATATKKRVDRLAPPR